MMLRFVLLGLVLLGTPFIDDGSDDGRRGNALYEQEDYEGAALAYEDGLVALEDDAPGAVRTGLLNNLGAARFRMEAYEEARGAFERAMEAAPAEPAFARAAYNAGNASFALQDLETALDYYKRALLANPDDEAAKFNYEYVKRQQEQQQQQQQDQQQDGDQGGEGDQENDDNQQQGEGDQQNPDGEQQEGDEPQQGDQQNEGSQDPSEQQPSEEQDGEPQQGEGQPQPDPSELSRAQAERMLQALQNDEADLLRQVLRPKTRPRRVEKDW